MSAQYVFRLTGKQHQQLQSHLFQEDGKESVAIILCGRRLGEARHILCAHEIHPVPNDACDIRTSEQVKWSTSLLRPLLQRAHKKGLSVFKIHSHPSAYKEFSTCDNNSDRELFPSIYGWVDDDGPHGSLVMLPDGKIFGRIVQFDGSFDPIELISLAGNDIKFWHNQQPVESPEFVTRHKQAFGSRTTSILGSLSIGIIGCSGTGSPIISMLSRLGVKKLTLVDPDIIEEKNVNRILFSTMLDAREKRPKVEAISDSISRIGLGTEIEFFQNNIGEPEIIKSIAECDILFGCVDSIDGRDILNKIAAYYLIPYFDVGVRLSADGRGGIDQICGSVHYLQPDGSSLLSRRVYTEKQLSAAYLKSFDPEIYQKRLEEKYISGVTEERPAVVSVNMFFASLAINEFLARIHPYRDDPNCHFAQNCISLTQSRFITKEFDEPCVLLAPKAGWGDAQPLLGMPMLHQSR